MAREKVEHGEVRSLVCPLVMADFAKRRFRPNLVLEGVSGAWVEDMWTEIAVGDLETDGGRLSIVSKGTRCLLPNVDTGTGERDAAVPFKASELFYGLLECLTND